MELSPRTELLVALFLGAMTLINLSDARAQLPPSGFEPGMRFPELDLADLDGNPVSLTQYRGKKVVLHIFASW